MLKRPDKCALIKTGVGDILHLCKKFRKPIFELDLEEKLFDANVQLNEPAFKYDSR